MNLKEVFQIKDETHGKTIENFSIVTIIVSGILITLGIGIGSYVPGIPVIMAMVGSFMVFVALVAFLAGEFLQIYEESKKVK